MISNMASDETPGIVSPTDAVAYQNGSVVSKTLVKHKTGSVTLFAFDAGQALSEHTVPFDAFVHVIDGSVLISISGKQYTVKTGQSILMPANVPHAVSAERRFKMVLSMVRVE